MTLVTPTFNDSQDTLVNVVPPRQFVFSKDSVTNSTLFRGRNVAIVISTPDGAAAQTYIKDAHGQELVAIRRHRFSDDTVKFANHYNSAKLKNKKWLHKEKLPTGEDSWRIKTPVGTYVWRTDLQTRLCLCHEIDLESPVAWERPFSPEGRVPLALFYEPVLEGVVDILLASFVVIEHEMRMAEKWHFIADGMEANKRANMMGDPMLNGGRR